MQELDTDNPSCIGGHLIFDCWPKAAVIYKPWFLSPAEEVVGYSPRLRVGQAGIE